MRIDYIPTTISTEAQEALSTLYELKSYERKMPAADDLDGWRRFHAENETLLEEENGRAVTRSRVTVTEAKLGGVGVLDVQPEGWTDDGKVLVYVHGGAYTLFSARSTLRSSAPMSRATGMRVISVDYTTAPFAPWEGIQGQVLSVFEALLAEGFTMDRIALYGDSAGGGLAASTILNLRDRGLGMPAAVVLLSPWVDISDGGDTVRTLEPTDPTLSYPVLRSSAVAYAGGLAPTDPRVSPLYADLTKGFSPTLITEGTKCIFLSGSTRFYQALDAAGHEVKLDLYEGMWHVFQMTQCPETEVSQKKISDFFHKHLGE